MIAEELLKIKSFGSDRKSAVTEGDMAQKVRVERIWHFGRVPGCGIPVGTGL